VLNKRLVDIYESDDPTTLDILFGSKSIQDAIDRVQALSDITSQDRAVSAAVAHAKTQVTAARKKTKKLRKTVNAETAVIRARTDQTRAVRDELVGARNDLSSTKQKKLQDLSTLTESERQNVSEIDALQAASERIAAQIRAAQARNTGPTQTASNAGLIWPVQGPVTSPFGWRWGRMHEGIDIGVGYGTPIHAAAGGTVIYCGWEEGYGNFVVIDHGGNLATAYGHQSSIAVTCGQQVSQGQVIGYVGCTGHCFGPHLHFEVRVNGNPVDPLGYLG
jgi:murein DD-endopeptidase MepM/ murein hydrolase activator NlpD